MPRKGFQALTRPASVLFDECDRALVESRTWHISAAGYVRSTIRAGAKCHGVFLAREIMQAPPGVDVDHINGDPLDNRRQNLRVVPHRINQQNRKVIAASGVRGVRFAKGKWYAQCAASGKNVNLGGYRTRAEAGAVVDAYLREHAVGYVPERNPLVNKNASANVMEL